MWVSLQDVYRSFSYSEVTSKPPVVLELRKDSVSVWAGLEATLTSNQIKAAVTPSDEPSGAN